MAYLSPESEGPQVVLGNKHADLEYAGSARPLQPGTAGFLLPIKEEIRKEGRICGFRRRTFWAMMITLITLIAIAGIVWGIQGTIQSRNLKHNQVSSITAPVASATTLSSPTSSVSTALTASTTQTPTTSAATSTAVADAANCPAVNGTTYTNSGYTYVKYCNVELLPTPTQPNDLAHQYTSSFDECIQACTNYNINVNKTCVGVTWDIFDPTNNSVDEMCFLKSQGGYLQNAYLDSQKICDSAMLVTSP